ncbi:phage holin family protein [Aeromonas caviae]|uniref:phage holin family protein n=1 Tax=Aeromonas caviae TaxID=648 RepID=UPI00214EAFF5|nr:phage holin family protein [Aeromonas caviae]MCR3893100.1 phage holin family protein [Aeromonas caviae]
MPEPISSSAATGTLSALALLSLFPGVDPGVLLGAFAGALVFIATTAELGNLRKAGLFVAAFVAGALAAPLVAAMLASVLPLSVEVPRAVGAMLASALAVHLLQWILRKTPEDLLKLRKGG